jgi:hypothetical protein
MDKKITAPAAVASALLIIVTALVFSSCLSTAARECSEPGQVIWDRGSDPDRDAPRWTRNPKAAAREAKVSRLDIPRKYVLYTGVSEDKNNEKGARFDAIDNMLERYAVYLQNELDRILPAAADKAGARLPDINTALGAYQAVGYLPKEPIESDVLRAEWTAKGRRCPLESGEPVYRVFVLGVFDKDVREVHLYDAAVETFKYAIIRGEDKDTILEEAWKLIRKI